ncbi:MAG TPA: tripartite tricarboxylate transporter TctB family protein [Candidatus Methylomirabilis sp.]|nr:tripartite tricarboxylate transporter TctB family protein [Candidatus Methylomirabilis sp.]
MALTRDRVAGLALLLFSLAVMWEDRVYPLGSLHNPGPGYMPMLLAIVLGAMAALVVLGGGGSPPLASLEWSEKRHAIAILLGCAFTALAMERLGYRLTVIVLVGFLLWAVERKRPVVVIAMALALSLGTFYVFCTLLRVPLPLGPRGF